MLQLDESANVFVSAESDTFYQHTAGLVLLDASQAPDFCFEKLKAFIGERLAHIPQFRWKLKEVPLGLDLPYWVEDEKYHVDRHIHRIAVPAPGDARALGELAGYLCSRRLDRAKPLWEIWFIEGLAGGRYALLQKQHHGLMDGQGAQKIGEALCDFEPDAPRRTLDTDFAQVRTGGAPSDAEVLARTAAKLLQTPARTARHAWSMLAPQWRRGAAGTGAAARAPAGPAPRLPCNGPVGTGRAFAFTSLPLADIKRIKERFEVSVNDVVLALTTGAVRHWLQPQGALPREPVRVNMAVSLRKEGDSAASNAVTTVNIALPTHLDDPLERLQFIHAESDAAKRSARGGQSSILELVGSLPPFAVGLLNRAMTPELMLATMKCNFVVSNVRGSPRPMYLAGARLEAMYPVSILAPGVGLNFTCVSYVDHVDFGLTCEPDLVQDPWSIARGLEHALAEYRALAGPKRRARTAPKPPPRAPAPRRTRTAPAARRAR